MLVAGRVLAVLCADCYVLCAVCFVLCVKAVCCMHRLCAVCIGCMLCCPLCGVMFGAVLFSQCAMYFCDVCWCCVSSVF